MKAANVFQIEQALDQPITPQQRQTAAANNPVAALIAQRLDGLENSFRTKMQTPPPPQGTVMNQYYQWPQQQMAPMGLAQPGLEELAQQYAAGGLVAFSEGGYADGDSDGDLYDVDGSEGYSGGGDVRGLLDGLFNYDLGNLGEDEADIQRLQNLPEQYKKAMERGEQLPAPPVSEQEDRPIGEYIASTMREKLGLHTPDEGDKLQDKINQKTEEHAARVADMEAPSKGKGRGMSTLQAQDYMPTNMARGLPSMLAGYEDAPDVPRTQGLRQPGEAPVQPSTVVITDPEHRDTITRITSPEAGLSADQQIAALAKYFQTDTSEAMRIKSEMERDNAKANNLDMFAAMMGAIGLGIGTNAPRGQQWGAGLAGLASGLAGASKQADARQGKLDELALKIKEMEGSGTRKAAEMVLAARAKAAAEAAEFKNKLKLEDFKGQVRERGQAAKGSGMNEYQQGELEAKAYDLALKDYEKQNMGNRPNPQLLKQLQDFYLTKLLNEQGTAMASAAPATQRSMGSFVGGRFTPYG